MNHDYKINSFWSVLKKAMGSLMRVLHGEELHYSLLADVKTWICKETCDILINTDLVV